MGRIMQAAEQRSVIKGPQCGTGKILAILEGEDLEDVKMLLASGRPFSVMSDAIRDFYPDGPGSDSISKHVREKCKCRDRGPHS